jgi:hypothetical protein
MDSAIAGAVKARFPRRGDPAPDHRRSDHHVKKAVVNALSPLEKEPDSHPVWAARELAPLNERHWDTFVAAVEHEDRTGIAPPAMCNTWLPRYGAILREQARMLPYAGPHSAAPVEAVNSKLSNNLLGERADRMRNRPRAIKLLDLLTLGLNNQVNELAFAKQVRIYLEANGGRAPRQRPHDDAKRHPSLFA